jgi:hypothetical protein
MAGPTNESDSPWCHENATTLFTSPGESNVVFRAWMVFYTYHIRVVRRSLRSKRRQR